MCLRVQSTTVCYINYPLNGAKIIHYLCHCGQTEMACYHHSFRNRRHLVVDCVEIIWLRKKGKTKTKTHPFHGLPDGWWRMHLLICGATFLKLWAVPENKMLKWAESLRRKIQPHCNGSIGVQDFSDLSSFMLEHRVSECRESRVLGISNLKPWYSILLLNVKHQMIASFQTYLKVI